MPAKSLPLAVNPGVHTPGSPDAAKGTFAFISLGCPKNTVDSERMLGKLAQDGYALRPDAAGADVVVVNTCGFIEPARQESLGVIREMLELKAAGKVGAVVVAGCMAERQREVLLEQVPDVDGIVGVFGREDITQVVDAARGAADLRDLDLFPPAPVRALEDTARLRITPRHYAYLKVSEGCDRLCTYCAIPKMRGKHVTKPIEEVVREARELAADGVRELIVVAQDTTYYGFDLYGRSRLADLLRALGGVDGIEWVRVLYAYPEHFTDEVVDALANTPKVIPYLDMPLQHINDRVLRRMLRRVDRASTERLLERLRKNIPDLALRTTFIVGFPGETDAEYEELRRFVADFGFERLGVFPYSPEPDTPAMKLDGHLPEDVKAARVAGIMEEQQAVAFRWAAAQVGRDHPVIVDGPDPEFPGHARGRTVADTPDIDCAVRVKGKGLRAGDFVAARVTAADGYDLIGRAVGRPW
ncbi:MAG: 30S ribosomal protein S12 methylthiotransferase RimO [Gemmataceae bacterium]|nr:30S ribosomal protein S12 methylthiotransferase RimO [Gemmataceae bacterium]